MVPVQAVRRPRERQTPNWSVNRNDVAQAFQPAGSGNFPVASSTAEKTRDKNVPLTRRQECLRYIIIGNAQRACLKMPDRGCVVLDQPRSFRQAPNDPNRKAERNWGWQTASVQNARQHALPPEIRGVATSAGRLVLKKLPIHMTVLITSKSTSRYILSLQMSAQVRIRINATPSENPPPTLV